MKKVYESATALESHMVKNLLENEGVESRVDGEYLQGGVGEFQAIGIVRLMVEDADYSKAKEIIDRWESIQVTDNVETKKGTSSANGFFFGVILTAGVAYWIFNSPVSVDGIDYNGDGFLDEKWVYKNNRISESYIDRNMDKKYDYIYYYDAKGLLKYAEGDDDFDGVFETELTFSNRVIAKEESDTNQNGIEDYTIYYKNGVLDSVDFIDERTGKIRKRQHYKLGKLVKADYDANGDGEFDTHYEYDIYEEMK